MKKVLMICFLIGGLITTFIFRNHIIDIIVNNLIYKDSNYNEEINEYHVNRNYYKFDDTDNFEVRNRDELIDSLFTIINKGFKEYEIKCSRIYDNCESDLEELLSGNMEIDYINNFVHPFNAYQKIAFNYNNRGRIYLNVEYLYTEEEKYIINEIVETKLKEYKNTYTSDRDIIRAFHDYIINITIYDEERAKEIENGNVNKIINDSHKATGPLVSGYAICGGYSDIMSIFLHELEIDNYKVSNENHIWNLVELDGSWYHLDLTWNDPIVDSGKQILLDTYFLIDYKELMNLNDGNHLFHESIFKEAI